MWTPFLIIFETNILKISSHVLAKLGYLDIYLKVRFKKNTGQKLCFWTNSRQFDQNFAKNGKFDHKWGLSTIDFFDEIFGFRAKNLE